MRVKSVVRAPRSEEHTSELQSHSDLHSFPTRRSSDLRNESLSAGNSKPLSRLLNQDASALQNSLQAIVGKLILEQLNRSKNEVASVSPVERASLDEGEICSESSKIGRAHV